VLVGPECRPTRKTLDPTAWFVLEELVMNADLGTSEVTVLVPASVRALATELGLSKDTVAAALRRLANAGIVQRVDQRNDTSGRFGRSTYLVDLAAIGMEPLPPADPRPTPSDTATSRPADLQAPAPDTTSTSAAPTRRPRRPPPSAQLSLLDTAPDTP
jgi:DNA-binding transcriptional MocR family regulator